MKKFIIVFVITTFFFSLIPPVYGYKQIPAYLCEMGLEFYHQGKFPQAMNQFRKALVINPDYKPALRYIGLLRGETDTPELTYPETRIKGFPGLKSSQDELIKEFEDRALSFQPKREIPLPQPGELGSFIELAIKNNQPTQIARQEIELAQFKVTEAQRNLFPALKIEGYNTTGVAYKLGYEEREIKLQLDHPLYYGGKLKNSLKQAEVNLEITNRNYDRLRIDVAHKAEVAYYNLIAGRTNLKIQEAILGEAGKIRQIVQKQFAADLVTLLENASTQSWYEQVEFQINSTKHDLAMAKLAFIQVLNISELPGITQEELKIRKLDYKLNDWLQAGLNHRPEIYLSELLVKFNQYGKMVEEAKNKFTVDLSTFISHYQGAWDTEDMNDSHNWYVGFKATKPWGGNTVTTSAVTETVEPRYGQSSATETNTASFSFGLMDNLQRLSDKKKSEIELQRSLSDLNETTKTINFEIKDAYLNYQKALLQATTTQSETEFRQREVKVLNARAMAGEIGFSNIMETFVSLSRAQTTHIQALANYFISLANLKKAAGYGIEI